MRDFYINKMFKDIKHTFTKPKYRNKIIIILMEIFAGHCPAFTRKEQVVLDFWQFDVQQLLTMKLASYPHAISHQQREQDSDNQVSTGDSGRSLRDFSKECPVPQSSFGCLLHLRHAQTPLKHLHQNIAVLTSQGMRRRWRSSKW